MRAYVGRAVLVVLVLIALLAAFVLIRTWTYGGQQVAADIALPAAPQFSQQRAAEHLSEAIRFRTITREPGDPKPGEEQPWITFHEWLRATYPAAHEAMERELLPGTPTLLYTWQGSEPTLQPLLFMAHQDVVPAEQNAETSWRSPPFEGRIVDGYVYGRGALDDKGSLIALMESAEALAAGGFTPKRTIHFLFGHDEEVTGSGAEAGVALLKSRNVTPELVLDEGSIVLDPSPLTGQAMAFIGVAEKGYLTIRMTARAEGGHSSMPPASTAVVQLARALVVLEENPMPAAFGVPPISEMFRAAAPDMNFMKRMALANLWLFRGMVEEQISQSPAANATVRTTMAPTQLSGSAKENVLAQSASAIVNFRIHPQDSEEDVLAHVRRVTADIADLEIEPIGRSQRGKGGSPVSPTDNRAYHVLAAVASEASDGAPVAPSLVVGATDSRYATEISDNVYRFIPAVLSSEELSGFHGRNERLSIRNLARMIRGYGQIILAMDSAP